jgi:non-heme chloroperoxidase
MHQRLDERQAALRFDACTAQQAAFKQIGGAGHEQKPELAARGQARQVGPPPVRPLANHGCHGQGTHLGCRPWGMRTLQTALRVWCAVCKDWPCGAVRSRMRARYADLVIDARLADKRRYIEEKAMPQLKVGVENSADIEIHYEDHGSGRPIVLIHGYPLDGNSWERQERVLLAQGYRVITYDRRGFGRSSQPTVGYDYDTFAADLNTLLEHLNLNDIILGGFSMGTGEVTRYLGKYGSSRVRKAALFGVIPPFLLKTTDNPEGVDGSVFEGIKAAIVADRYAYFQDFFNNFYNVDVLGQTKISRPAWQASFNVAVGSSPYATYACVDTWLTDFRQDLPKIDVPTLVVHGTEDRILPYEATAGRLPGLIKNLRLVTVDGGPHNIGWTHPEEVNKALLEFLAD